MGKENRHYNLSVKIFIGAENIVSPIGNNIDDNFAALQQNISGIKLYKNAGFKKEDLYLSKIELLNAKNKFNLLIENCLDNLLSEVPASIFESEKTILILSTTKGDMELGLTETIEEPIQKIKQKYALKHLPIVISNACTSGVLSIITAANLIRSQIYDHAIVIGCDTISEFVIYGFQSLYAISDEPCKPFDRDRKGITLGEGCAGVVLSKDNNLFKQQPLLFIEGSSSNDANHISGPSRTGEGLYRSIKNTLEYAKMNTEDIDFISAHGTATLFNDDMESIAFHRLGMNHIPLNSLKGYYGHTLGAAGVIETAICMQSLRNNLLVKSLGFENSGTPEPLNIITKNKVKELKTVLKTASGFGGCNASLILQKI